MTTLPKLQADVDAIRLRIAAQTRKDPDHMVALAMFGADLKRAEQRLAEFEAAHASGRRVFVDGRLAA